MNYLFHTAKTVQKTLASLAILALLAGLLPVAAYTAFAEEVLDVDTTETINVNDEVIEESGDESAENGSGSETEEEVQNVEGEEVSVEEEAENQKSSLVDKIKNVAKDLFMPFAAETVVMSTNITTGNTYETLQAAVSAAVAGDEIRLEDNITLGDTAIRINKSLTIDGNGMTITAPEVRGANSSNKNANVTIDSISTSNSVWGGVNVHDGSNLNIIGNNRHNETKPPLYSNKKSSVTFNVNGLYEVAHEEGDVVHYRLATPSPVVTSVTPAQGSYISGSSQRIDINVENTSDVRTGFLQLNKKPATGNPANSDRINNPFQQDVDGQWYVIVDTTKLQDGETYLFKVEAHGYNSVPHGYYGNNSAWFAHSYYFTVDNTAPTISWQKQPLPIYGIGAGFHVRPITNEVGTTESVYIDSISEDNLVRTLNSDHKNFDTTNTQNQALWDSLSDGVHKFIAVFEDNAGNVTTSESNSFIIDRTAPAAPSKLEWRTSTGAYVPSGGATNNANGVASWNASSEAGVTYVYAYWNNIAGNQWKENNLYEVPNLNQLLRAGEFNQGEGVHYMQVFAVDAAGNRSAGSNIVAIEYDTTSPTAEITTPETNGQVVSGVVNIIGTMTDGSTGMHWFEIKGPNGYEVTTGVEGRNNASSWTYAWDTSGLNGEYTIRYVATDRAGNRSDDPNLTNHITRTVVVDNLPDPEVPEQPEVPVQPAAAITSPVAKNLEDESLEVINTGAPLVLRAYDEGATGGVQWAVRLGSCNSNTGTVAGNVDGYSNNFGWTDGEFSADIDTNGWTAGNYCFVFNPNGTSNRLTHWIQVSNPTSEPETPVNPEEGMVTLKIEITGDGFGNISDNLERLSCALNNESEMWCIGTYVVDTVVTLTATPDAGSTFENSWGTPGFGTCTGNQSPCEVTMTTNITSEAHFDLVSGSNNPTPVTATGGGGYTPGNRSAATPEGEVLGESISRPEPLVLGEQTTIVPFGAPNTGAGGTANMLTIMMLGQLVALPRREIVK